MGKVESLRSDLDLIKELEELKLKQKILINSLTHKQKDNIEVHLIDISKKIEFLVKIFKEANEGDENNSNEVEKTHINELSKKIDDIKIGIDSKLDDILEQISSLKNSISQSPKPQSTSSNSDMNLIPKPDFNVGSKVDSTMQNQTEDKEKKKKKWF